MCKAKERIQSMKQGQDFFFFKADLYLKMKYQK